MNSFLATLIFRLTLMLKVSFTFALKKFEKNLKSTLIKKWVPITKMGQPKNLKFSTFLFVVHTKQH